MRKIGLFVVVIGFFALLYLLTNSESFLYSKKLGNTLSEVKKMITKPSTDENKVVMEDSQEVLVSNLVSADETQAQPLVLHKMEPQEFKKWVVNEARSMNSTNLDTDAKQIELKAQAQTLQIEQIQILSELAMDASQPINDRILAAYLIRLNSESYSLQALSDVAKTEIPVSGPIVPHSESELKNAQELAIRYMQIDELFERAKTDTNAYDKLNQLTQEAHSAQVRSYAKKKLSELK